MEREYIAHHIRRRHSGLEHLTASMQPKKHSEDCTEHSKDSEDGYSAPEAPEALGHADRSPEALEVPDKRLQKCSKPARLNYEELGGLSGPGQQDCPWARNILE